MRLGADLDQAWSHPAATTATRKRIIRAVLNEIVVRIEDGYVDLLLHWQGGDHTALKVKKNAAGKHRWTVAEETEVLIRELARLMPDKTIAAVLNRVARVRAWLPYGLQQRDRLTSRGTPTDLGKEKASRRPAAAPRCSSSTSRQWGRRWTSST
jgi:hypothetical protein